MRRPYYSDEFVTLYHGDAREILPTLAVPTDAAFVLDPPYGINHSSNHGASWAGERIHGDESVDLREWVVARYAPRPMFVFGTWKVGKPAGTRQTLIWDKGPAFGMGDLAFPWKNSFEEIYVLGTGFRGRRDEAVMRGHIVVSWESRGRKHQHEKPVTLITALLRKVPDATLIVDPCCGSGPVLEAAKLAGVRAVGVEIDEASCEATASRLHQGVLFAGSKESA